jgi:2-polyprenyl-3-methyl-5-hydroxy-6-metoxy-1,4-benzoquinol methylase
MSLLANQQDFEANGLYSNYHRYKLFQRRAEIIRQTFSPQSVLVVGCGWGFLVDELRMKGLDAWGVDLSEYAIRKAHAEVPDVYRYIEKADGRVARSLERVGPGHWDVVVTEDVLTVCSNEQEVSRFVAAARAVGDQAFHIVTCWLPGREEKVKGRDSRVMWKYQEEWAELVAPDPILNNFEEIVRYA